jgi:hypothetical protein
MAKQVGPIYYEGTIGDIVFYQMDGEYYARFKGNYKSRKQMQRNPRFERTLHYSKQFGKSSTTASWVYQRHLPKELMSRDVWNTFISKASRLRNNGRSEKEIKEALIQYCEQLIQGTEAAKQSPLLKPETTTPRTSERRTSELDSKPEATTSGTSERRTSELNYKPETLKLETRSYPIPNPQLQVPPLSSSQ